MYEKKMQRKNFIKYLGTSLTETGFQFFDSFSNFFQKRMEAGKWLKALEADQLSTLPRMLFIQGFWVFLSNDAKSAFKALCPVDNSMLQHQMPADHLFCLRCSRIYNPFNGECLNTSGDYPEKNSPKLTIFPVKIDEGGVYVFITT